MVTCLECIANADAPDSFASLNFRARVRHVAEAGVTHAFVLDVRSSHAVGNIGWWKCRMTNDVTLGWCLKGDR